MQLRITQELQEKVGHLTLQLRESTKSMKVQEKELDKLRRLTGRNKLSTSLEEEYESGRGDLEKILIDINREIDEIFIEDVENEKVCSPPKV